MRTKLVWEIVLWFYSGILAGEANQLLFLDSIPKELSKLEILLPQQASSRVPNLKDRIYTGSARWPGIEDLTLDRIGTNWDQCLKTRKDPLGSRICLTNFYSDVGSYLKEKDPSSNESAFQDSICNLLTPLKHRRAEGSLLWPNRRLWLWLPGSCINTKEAQANKLKAFARLGNLFVVVYGAKSFVELTNIWDSRFNFSAVLGDSAQDKSHTAENVANTLIQKYMQRLREKQINTSDDCTDGGGFDKYYCILDRLAALLTYELYEVQLGKSHFGSLNNNLKDIVTDVVEFYQAPGFPREALSPQVLAHFAIPIFEHQLNLMEGIDDSHRLAFAANHLEVFDNILGISNEAVEDADLDVDEVRERLLESLGYSAEFFGRLQDRVQNLCESHGITPESTYREDRFTLSKGDVPDLESKYGRFYKTTTKEVDASSDEWIIIPNTFENNLIDGCQRMRK